MLRAGEPAGRKKEIIRTEERERERKKRVDLNNFARHDDLALLPTLYTVVNKRKERERENHAVLLRQQQGDKRLYEGLPATEMSIQKSPF